MRPSVSTLIVVAAWLLAVPVASAQECTAAVVSAAGSAKGAPLLWKNRDTDTLSNKEMAELALAALCAVR